MLKNTSYVRPLYRWTLFLIVCLLIWLASPVQKGNAVPQSTAKLAFISDRDGNREIYLMNTDGGAQTNLTHSAAGEKAFTWSPDQTKIAFIKKDPANNADDSNLYVMNADGSGVISVTSDNFQYQNSSNLSWSPDGTRLAYISGNDLLHYLSVVNADGSNKRNLREASGPFLDVAWSPDGNKIAFSVGLDLNSANLWVMNADGSAVTRLTDHETPGIYSRSPSWSPDSMRLVFESNRTGNDEIYMLWVRLFYSEPSLNLTKLTNNSAADVDPAWSPDGQRIAFSTNRDGNFEIYTMRWDDGTNLTRLTTNNAADVDPEWQPSGAAPFVPEDFIQFSSSSYRTFEDPVGNSGVQLEIVVTRLGRRLDAARAFYTTFDGTASNRTDYTPMQGTIEFAPGQSSASFVVPITYDSFIEGNETVQLGLTFVGGTPNVAFGSQRHAIITISDFYVGPPTGNAIDLPDNFVRQHYHDFLGREPDASGLAFWTGQITACGTNADCVRRKREDVSGAFFNSIEYQQTGFFIYRLTVASFGRFPDFWFFMMQKAQVADRVIVGELGWEQRLQENKNRFLQQWITSSEFITLCGGARSSSEFVDILLRNTQIPATSEYRAALIADLDAGRKTQIDVLREIVENADFKKLEFNRAFVLTQYFGYLRRNPTDLPDMNLDGFNFWLNKLNQFNGDFRRAEMVKAFINSSEYRRRFGP